MAEIKLVREAQLARGVFDRKPFVGEQPPRLMQPRALDVFIHGALAGFLKRGAQAGAADFSDGGEFLGLPVAQWIGGDGIEHADDRHGQFGVRRIQKITRDEQFPELISNDDMDLPFPAGGAATNEPE